MDLFGLLGGSGGNNDRQAVYDQLGLSPEMARYIQQQQQEAAMAQVGNALGAGLGGLLSGKPVDVPQSSGPAPGADISQAIQLANARRAQLQWQMQLAQAAEAKKNEAAAKQFNTSLMNGGAALPASPPSPSPVPAGPPAEAGPAGPVGANPGPFATSIMANTQTQNQTGGSPDPAQALSSTEPVGAAPLRTPAGTNTNPVPQQKTGPLTTTEAATAAAVLPPDQLKEVRAILAFPGQSEIEKAAKVRDYMTHYLQQRRFSTGVAPTGEVYQTDQYNKIEPVKDLASNQFAIEKAKGDASILTEPEKQRQIKKATDSVAVEDYAPGVKLSRNLNTGEVKFEGKTPEWLDNINKDALTNKASADAALNMMQTRSQIMALNNAGMLTGQGSGSLDALAKYAPSLGPVLGYSPDELKAARENAQVAQSLSGRILSQAARVALQGQGSVTEGERAMVAKWASGDFSNYNPTLMDKVLRAQMTEDFKNIDDYSQKRATVLGVHDGYAAKKDIARSLPDYSERVAPFLQYKDYQPPAQAPSFAPQPSSSAPAPAPVAPQTSPVAPTFDRSAVEGELRRRGILR